MIVISGITISNPLDTVNSVTFQILDNSLNILKTILYTGQTSIYYQELSAGTYHIKINDGTSTETCEVDKSVYAVYDVNMYIGTGFNHYVAAITEISTGEYLVGGYFTQYSGDTSNRIIKLNVDGSHNTSFNIGNGFSGGSGNIYGITECSNGMYLACGSFSTYNGTEKNKVVRLYSNGSIDSVFKPIYYSGDNNIQMYKTIETPDNKYIICGMYDNFDGITQPNRILRLKNDGSVDMSFSTGVTIDNNWVKDFIKTSDNKYLICGGFNHHETHINYYITRLTIDGVWDNTFIVGQGFNNYIESIVETSDGNYLIGGHFTSFSGESANRLIMLDVNGNRVSTDVFNTGVGFAPYGVSYIIKTSDDGYLIGGNFTSYSGQTANRIIKLKSDGSIDTSFNSGTGFDGGVLKICETSDGRYLVGGMFNTYNNITSNKFIKLNANGSVFSISS